MNDQRDTHLATEDQPMLPSGLALALFMAPVWLPVIALLMEKLGLIGGNGLLLSLASPLLGMLTILIGRGGWVARIVAALVYGAIAVVVAASIMFGMALALGARP